MDSLEQTTDRSEKEFPQWLLVTMILGAFFIVWSNLVPIIGVFKIRNLRKNVANYFIVSLAFTDMLTGLVVIPLGVFHEIEYVHRNRFISTPSWISNNGSIFCDVFQGVINFTGYCFVWHMALIACDRYYRITQPIRYKRWMSPSKALLFILLLNILSFLLSIYLYHR